MRQARIVCALLLTAFPFLPYGVSTGLIAVFFVLSMMEVRLRHPTGIQWKSLAIYTIPVVIFAALWLYHGDQAKYIERWTLWLFVPAIWLAVGTLGEETKKLIKWSFVLVVVVAGFYATIRLAFAGPISSQGFSYHVRTHYEQTLHLHPTFLSFLSFWCAFVLLESNTKLQWIRWTLLGMLLTIGILAGGRMPMLAFLLIAIIFFAAKAASKGRLLQLGVLFVILCGAAAIFPGNRERLQELAHINWSPEPGEHMTSTDIRVATWRCAFEGWQQAPTLGLGMDGMKTYIIGCSEATGQYEMYKRYHPSHNQYLEFGIVGGLVAFILLTAWLLFLLFKAKNAGNILLVAWLAYLMLNLLTENYLSRQFGMISLGFFLGLLDRQPVRDKP